jgi:hypothetical protein
MRAAAALVLIFLAGCSVRMESDRSEAPVPRKAGFIDVYEVGDGVKCYRGTASTLSCVKVAP